MRRSRPRLRTWACGRRGADGRAAAAGGLGVTTFGTGAAAETGNRRERLRSLMARGQKSVGGEPRLGACVTASPYLRARAGWGHLREPRPRWSGPGSSPKHEQTRTQGSVWPSLLTPWQQSSCRAAHVLAPDCPPPPTPMLGAGLRMRLLSAAVSKSWPFLALHVTPAGIVPKFTGSACPGWFVWAPSLWAYVNS